MNGKFCPKCQEFLPFELFGRKKNGNLYSYCKKCTNIQTVERQRLLKVKAVEYKGGKCERCGYNKCFAALDFHHKDRDEKESSLSRMMLLKFQKLIPELDKCTLLCSNCHREIHSEMSNIKIDTTIVEKNHEEFLRRSDEKAIDPNVLKEMVKEKSIKDISNDTGISIVILKNIARKNKIVMPHNKNTKMFPLKFDITKAELEKLVWTMSTEKIGKLFGVTGKAIEKRCRKLNIKKPGRGYWAKIYAHGNVAQLGSGTGLL